MWCHCSQLNEHCNVVTILRWLSFIGLQPGLAIPHVDISCGFSRKSCKQTPLGKGSDLHLFHISQQQCLHQTCLKDLSYTNIRLADSTLKSINSQSKSTWRDSRDMGFVTTPSILLRKSTLVSQVHLMKLAFASCMGHLHVWSY